MTLKTERKEVELLVIHWEGQDSSIDFGRTVMPNDVSASNYVMTEYHSIPFSVYSRIYRVPKKLHNYFI